MPWTQFAQVEAVRATTQVSDTTMAAATIGVSTNNVILNATVILRVSARVSERVSAI